MRRQFVVSMFHHEDSCASQTTACSCPEQWHAHGPIPENFSQQSVVEQLQRVFVPAGVQVLHMSDELGTGGYGGIHVSESQPAVASKN